MAEKSKPALPKGYDFGGWATVYNQKCADGRTIAPGAFAHTDGKKVPLVWQHFHDDPDNILGHVIVKHYDEGVYAFGKFNATKGGTTAKTLVHGGDIEFLSIYANKVVESNSLVHNGQIREVSLVISGANPGATIDNLGFQHADGSEEMIDSEILIRSGLSIEFAHSEEEEEAVVHTEDEKTIGEVFDTLTEVQKTAVYALIGNALDADVDSEEEETEEELAQSEIQGETDMKTNIFEGENGEAVDRVLSHSDVQAIFSDAKKLGSLREAVLVHAGTYGIDNISNLFPDAKSIRTEPDWLSREMGWVGVWMGAVNHTPFSRIKSMYADITAEEARAKGYTTGDQKIEEVFAVLKRTTEPQTVYKLQKLDRDDILDITDFNVVSWLKAEMRMMLEEEIARACLVGDGRTFGVDDDAINPLKVRPILTDDAVYSHKVSLAVGVTDPADIIDDIIQARVNYKGSGQPMAFMSNTWLVSFLLLKDTTGRRIYRTVADLAAELNVSRIVETEVLEGVQRSDPTPFTADLIAVIVNPRDYTIGADKGGAVNMFDDFDIDYNQHKYLIETRISGALTKPKSALIIERKTA